MRLTVKLGVPISLEEVSSLSLPSASCISFLPHAIGVATVQRSDPKERVVSLQVRHRTSLCQCVIMRVRSSLRMRALWVECHARRLRFASLCTQRQGPPHPLLPGMRRSSG
jgi:hypothetical protein